MREIIRLQPSDSPSIKKLLGESDLPTDDLEKAPIQFYGIKEKNELIGIGALEVYGENAIVRSLVVKSEYRGKRLGMRLTEFLEQEAKQIGVDQLYLLTTTAELFFKALNYQKISREQCPSSIRKSAEFEHLCPSTAACLFKIL